MEVHCLPSLLQVGHSLQMEGPTYPVKENIFLAHKVCLLICLNLMINLSDTSEDGVRLSDVLDEDFSVTAYSVTVSLSTTGRFQHLLQFSAIHGSSGIVKYSDAAGSSTASMFSSSGNGHLKSSHSCYSTTNIDNVKLYFCCSHFCLPQGCHVDVQ